MVNQRRKCPEICPEAPEKISQIQPILFFIEKLAIPRNRVTKNVILKVS